MARSVSEKRFLASYYHRLQELLLNSNFSLTSIGSSHSPPYRSDYCTESDASYQVCSLVGCAVGRLAMQQALQAMKDETVFRILGQSMIDMTQDCGYHLAQRATLDILTDVCCDYIKKVASLLRIAVDTEDWRDSESDFVDSLERVLHQMNVPSVANLHQFICKMAAIKKHRSTNQPVQYSSSDNVDEQQ